MRAVEFTLKRYLNTHGLTAYRLAQATEGRVSRRTVYALARGEVTRVDLGTLGAVITALEELTGEEVTPADLLAAVTVPEPDTEAAEWAAADLMPDLEPYDWGEGGEPSGEPVRYVPGVGFVVGEA
ncbi:helix-turn-helix domain-containing protein [Deinococcus aestuarii]|uniref:helix-turn-helix domain-containing protein n=1 Tax=Deinococcus aestuarii TaxID=2774531 RepID=UPI001C0C0269|nr:helix-turn-helix transcriptional regulator [Deinococcus aestuarii]